MTAETRSPLRHDQFLLTLLGGAALGAILVAMSQPDTRRRLKISFRELGSRLLGGNRESHHESTDEYNVMFI